MHTQWIEAELMPRLEAQPRPESLPSAAMRRFPIELDGRRMMIGLPADLLSGVATAPADPTAAATRDPAALEAPVPGTLVRWLAEDGAAVEAGQDVAVIDAMKMETKVVAHRAGVLRHHASEGAAIAVGDPLGAVEA